MWGTVLIDAATIIVSYSGDSHGGHTDIYALIDRQRQNYLEGIRFHDSIEGLVEGLYFAFALCQHGTYWHDLSGRDYTFLFSGDQLAQTLEARFESGEDPQLGCKKIDRPCGVRLLVEAHGYRVSCMVASPVGTIVDLSVWITAGRATIEPRLEMSVSSVQMFY